MKKKLLKKKNSHSEQIFNKASKLSLNDINNDNNYNNNNNNSVNL